MCLRTLWAFIYPTNVGRPSPQTFRGLAGLIFLSAAFGTQEYHTIMGFKSRDIYNLPPNEKYLPELMAWRPH